MYRPFPVASQPSGLGNAGCVYPPPGPHLRLLAIQGRGALQAATRGHCGPTRGGQWGQTVQEDLEEMGHIKL